jgi:Ca-activated chloride channel homolog
MNWGNPLAAWGFVLLLIVGALGWVSNRYAQRSRANFVSDSMFARIGTQDTRRQRLRLWLWMIAGGCLILALMQPRYGYVLETKSTQNRAIMLAIDVSKSMAAQDVQPSRFEVARQHLFATMATFQDHGIGLIVFAGDAYLQCPITTDHDALRSYIQELKPGFLPVQGTDLAAVLRIAEDTAKQIRGPFDLFLFSDGEALSGNNDRYLDTLSKAGVRIYSVGIGQANGEPIPVENKQGEVTGYKRDKQGEIVISKLDVATLTHIAKSTEGLYINSTDSQSIEQLLSLVDKKKSDASHATQVRHYNEWYMIPLTIALLLLALQWMIPDKRRRQTMLQLLVIIAVCGFSEHHIYAASPADVWHYKQGEKAYQSEDYKAATQRFSKLSTKDPGLNYYNLGNVAYQAQALDEAEAYYKNAEPYLKTTEEKAWLTHNQGNTAFGQQKYKEAIDFYRKSLIYNPADKATKINLELAIKKMKEKPPEQKKPDPKNPPKDNKKEQEKEKKQQEAQQTLKTLRQKEKFNTLPPNTNSTPTEKDW